MRPTIRFKKLPKPKKDPNRPKKPWQPGMFKPGVSGNPAGRRPKVAHQDRWRALQIVAAKAACGDLEARAKLDELRQSDPALYERLAEALADITALHSTPLPRYRPPESAFARGELPNSPPEKRAALRPSPAPLDPFAAAPIGSDGLPLYPATPPPDPRIEDLRSLFANSKRLRRRGYPNGWERIFTAHGNTDKAWRLIAAAMRDDESAEEFLVRCMQGAAAARRAEASLHVPRRHAMGIRPSP